MALTPLQKNVIATFLQENFSDRERTAQGSGWVWLTDLVVSPRASQVAIIKSWLDGKKTILAAIDTNEQKLVYEARIAEEIATIDAVKAGL